MKSSTVWRHCTYLDLISNVEGVVVATVREDDAVKGRGHTIGTGCLAPGPSVLEVGRWLLNPGATAKDDEPSNDYEEQGTNLYDSNAVGEPVCILCVENQCCRLLVDELRHVGLMRRVW